MPNYVQLKYMPERHMSTEQAEAYFGVKFCACPFCHYPFPGLFMGHRIQVICPNCCAEGPVSDVLGFEGGAECCNPLE